MVCRGKDLNKLIYYGREYSGGARYEGRIVVPPVYRSVKSPVGRYCAIEAEPVMVASIQFKSNNLNRELDKNDNGDNTNNLNDGAVRHCIS